MNTWEEKESRFAKLEQFESVEQTVDSFLAEESGT